MKHKNSFKKKIFQNGSYSVFITLAVIAVLIVANLIVGAIPTSVTKLDFSEQQMFSISDQTEKLLSGLDRDVTVYFVAQSGNEDSVVEELLEKYEDLSKHITVEVVDPAVNPAFAAKYTTGGIVDNSLVVVTDLRYQVVSYDSIYVSETTYDSEGNEVTSQTFNGESALTSAIDYTTSTNLPVAYNLIGHSELAFSDTLTEYIAKENIEVIDLSIATEGAIPDDCGCLIINGPMKEISENEIEVIREYLDNGGHLLYIKNYQTAVGTNIDDLVAEYGISIDNSLVFEGNSDYTYSNYPNMIIPNFRTHTITEPIIENQVYCLVPNAMKLVLDSDSKSELTALLTTTTSGYAKDLSKELTTTEKTAQDEKGSFVLAAAAEYQGDISDKTTQIVVVSSMDFLDETVSYYVGDGNYDFVINALGWMCEHGSSIAIHSKNLGSDGIYISSGQANIWLAVLIFAIPIILIIIGIIIWVMRRRR